MIHLPFSIFRRKGRGFYRSSGYRNSVQVVSWGRPVAKDTHIGLSLQDVLRDITTMSEAGFICSELKRKGLLKGYVITESRYTKRSYSK
jgi:hypothetical protein